MSTVLNKKALYVAILASFGALASQANAAALVFASELPPGSDIAIPTWAVPVTSFAPTTANPLYLQYALTGGASFDTIASADLVCSAVAGGTTGALTPANIQLVAGGVGTANVTFVVTAITAGALMVGCTLTNHTAKLGTWPATVNETVTLTYGSNLSPTGSNSTALATAASFFTNATTAGTNLALVASGFVSFTAVAGAANATTARIGSFTLAENTNLLATGGAANAISGLTGFVTAMTVSLGGAILAATPANSGAVFITVTAFASAPASCTGGGTLLVSAIGGASAISFSAVAPAIAAYGSAALTFSVCMSVTGQVIPAGTITYGVVGNPNVDPNNTLASAFQISTLIASGTTLGTITHNGVTTTILNLPASTNSDAGFIRVYNTSAGAGPVTATVWKEDGTQLSTNCTLSASLAAGGVLVMSSAAVETACLFPAATSGRYRLVINGAFSTMRAQGLVRAAGVLVNLSGDTSGNGID